MGRARCFDKDGKPDYPKKREAGRRTKAKKAKQRKKSRGKGN